jgi:hypothetical protein
MVNMTKQACDIATTEQMSALARLHNSSIDFITVQRGGLGLSDSYLAFAVHYIDGSTPMYGGIDPEGRVST